MLSPNYRNMQKSELLQKLLMSVTYCAYKIKCNVGSIPSIMSGIRHGMVTRWITKNSQTRHMKTAGSSPPDATSVHFGYDQPHCTSEHILFGNNEAGHVGNGHIDGVLPTFAFKMWIYIANNSPYRRQSSIFVHRRRIQWHLLQVISCTIMSFANSAS